MAQETGQAELRALFIDGAVKGFAERMYKFKQAVTISSSNAWSNKFFRENPNPLTAQGAGSTIKGTPRGADPWQGVVTWTPVTANIDKYFYSGVILWEDILTDEISVQTRTLYRVSEAITKAVDDAIFNVLAENVTATSALTPTAVQVVTIGAGKHWSGSSGAIIDDIMNAKTLIATSNYDVSNLMMFINPRDHRSIVNYLAKNGAAFPSIGEDMATNGRAGRLAGVDLVISNSVPASHALLVVPKICATWKEAVSFRTTVVERAYQDLNVLAVEEGVTQLTDPNAVVVFNNTRGDDS